MDLVKGLVVMVSEKQNGKHLWRTFDDSSN